MNFGQAIEALKGGHAIRRAGWNGKGMCVFLTAGSYDPDPAGVVTHIDGVSVDLFRFGDHGTVTRLPHMAMQTATGSTLNGWLASQTDVLAEDWEVVDSGVVG